MLYFRRFRVESQRTDFQLRLWCNIELNFLSAFLVGAVLMCLALTIRFMGSSVISVMFLVLGAMKGPMFGMFLLGTFCPWVNKIVSVTSNMHE